jgi:membrane associated rhomboid family serine protease
VGNLDGLLLRLIEKFPWVTVGLYGASFLFQFFWGQYVTIWGWLSDTQTGLMVRFVLHPILHASWPHLYGNIYFLIAGGLVESWMFSTHKMRWTMLLLCYLISLDVTLLGWIAITPTHRPPVGLSGMIASALAFLLVYCLMFLKKPFRGWNLLGLAGTVLLLVMLIYDTLNVVTGVLIGLYNPENLYPLVYHFLAFGQGIALGFLLLRRVRQDTD